MDKKTQWILTGLSSVMCGLWMHYTNGDSGIGWFVFSMMLIWGM